MSKRFGRQQKRKMRAALEQAMGKVRVLDKALGFSRNTVAAQERTISTARRLLGSYCAALPLKSKEFKAEELSYYDKAMRVHIPGPVVRSELYGSRHTADQAAVALRHAEALVVKFTVKGAESFPLGQHQAVVRLHVGGELMMLAITEDAFQNMTAKEATHSLAYEFAEMLTASKILKGII